MHLICRVILMKAVRILSVIKVRRPFFFFFCKVGNVSKAKHFVHKPAHVRFSGFGNPRVLKDSLFFSPWGQAPTYIEKGLDFTPIYSHIFLL